jgi:hypothetical protein
MSRMDTPNAGRRVHILPTSTYHGRVPVHGGKIPLHQRVNVGAPRQNVQFTGQGIVPDMMSEHALTMLPEASKTLLGDPEGFVPGSEGMLPAPGYQPAAQLGQQTDTGAGGAGSFATKVSYKARG